MFRGRSAIEIMVIVFTMLLCIIVVMVSATVSYVKITSPASDISTAISFLTSVVSAILAALLGLVAGRSEALNATRERIDDPVYQRSLSATHENPVYQRPPKEEAE